jgi:hypothetical protein
MLLPTGTLVAARAGVRELRVGAVVSAGEDVGEGVEEGPAPVVVKMYIVGEVNP